MPEAGIIRNVACALVRGQTSMEKMAAGRHTFVDRRPLLVVYGQTRALCQAIEEDSAAHIASLGFVPNHVPY